MVNWKKNLVVVWLSQFLSMAGFTFAMPFYPYFMQELGVTGERELKIFVALFAGAAPLSLAIFSPIWGMVGDRHGRRLMLLRANLGAAVFLCLMARVANVWQLVGLRMLQGVLTGTMTAAQTMVSVHTPSDRTGFALGALSSAVYCGCMAGAGLGGLFADRYGYRMAFLGAGMLLLASGLLILFGATERFVRPDPAARETGAHIRAAAPLRLIMPALLLLGGIAFVRNFDQPYLPLLVQEIHGGMEGAARLLGLLAAFAAGAGFVSAILLGHLADRIRPAAIGVCVCVLSGLLMIPVALAHTIWVLVAAKFGVALCIGGLEPVFQAWISKTTPREIRGTIFGWAGTARSLGWMAAPVVGGTVAWALDIRPVFLVGGLCFFALIPVILSATRKAGTDNG